jgi:hypothetical protein
VKGPAAPRKRDSYHLTEHDVCGAW